MTARIVSSIVILVLWCLATPAAVGQIKLETLVCRADFVVFGKVVDVNEGVAKLQVIQTVKGNPEVKNLYFRATPLWFCDVSKATKGEAVLIFLEDSFFGVKNKSWPPSLIDGKPFLSISHFGRGRFRVVDNNSGAQILIARRMGTIIFPNKLRATMQRVDGGREFGWIDLKTLIDYIQTKR